MPGSAGRPRCPARRVPIGGAIGRLAQRLDSGHRRRDRVRADLPGPARKESEPVIGDDQEAQGVAYRAFEPSGRVEAVLHIAPLPTEERTGPQTVAERTAHLVDGEPPVTRPLVVEGHPAVDARIDGWPRAGGSGSGTLLLRIIDTPRFEITIEANGDTADDPLVREVFDRVCASLRIP